MQPPRGDPGRNVGFIVDRVKGAPPGDGVLRLTGYHRDTGQVGRADAQGVSAVPGTEREQVCFCPA